MSSIIKGLTDEQHITKKEPEVHVPGYGTMPLDMLKRHVQALSKDFDTLIQQGAFLKAAYRSEQFYNALMALAKALPKPNKVDETHSTGTTVGSAGIGGGAGLGIDKSPIEKVLEKPFGVIEGKSPPKAGFNPKPVKIDREGPDTPDNYEYTAFIPRDKRERGEEWAIRRDIQKANARLKKKPKPVPDTGFYKNYLKNRPVREEEMEEEQAPMFTPEEKMVNANDPMSDGWRVYKAKPSGIMEGIINEDAYTNSLFQEFLDSEYNKNEGSYIESLRNLGMFIRSKGMPEEKAKPIIRKLVYKLHPSGINEEQLALAELKCWTGYKRVPGTKAGEKGSCVKKESSIIKGIQEDLLSEGNPVNVWAAIRPHGGLPPNLRASSIPVDKLPNLGFGSGDARDKSNYIRYYYDIMKGNAKYQLDKEYEKKGKIPDIEKIESYLAKLARSAGLEQDANGKWFFDASSMTKEMKSHLTYLEYNFGIPKKYKPKQKKFKDESE